MAQAPVPPRPDAEATSPFCCASPPAQLQAIQAARQIVVRYLPMKKRQTAAEYGAELERDPEFVRRRQEQEARTQQYLDEMHRAEIPLINALAEAGIRLTSVWDLVNTGAQYPDALPILFDHLQRPYPDSVRSGIARALAVPEAKRWWKPLLELFRANHEAKVNGFKTALACALVGAVDEDVLGDVIELVQDPTHGEHRVMLLSALSRSASTEAREALEGAAEDPQLMKEAKVQLRYLARRKRKGVFD
jgi:HEAT repeat protein